MQGMFNGYKHTKIFFYQKIGHNAFFTKKHTQKFPGLHFGRTPCPTTKKTATQGPHTACKKTHCKKTNGLLT